MMALVRGGGGAPRREAECVGGPERGEREVSGGGEAISGTPFWDVIITTRRPVHSPQLRVSPS